ncbi:MAG: hypothetical protein LBH25_13795 [Fibromonadaceae bacterium]|jgi:uncharacterized coiled-coil protein SlyX|nr:hypothetical protein [Fibromonadaceae bacterium]
MKKRKLTSAHIWAMIAENNKQFAETDKKIDRMCERVDKMAARVDSVTEQMGGINDNIGHHAEQFFQDVFRRKLEFGMVKYDEMIPNLTHKDKGVKIEFDIALLNGNSIALIEVKNRIHPDFVKELAEERIEKFRKYFPRYSDYSAYLGIAGFSFSDEVLDQASRYGIGIIKQVGEGVEISAKNLRTY